MRVSFLSTKEKYRGTFPKTCEHEWNMWMNVNFILRLRAIEGEVFEVTVFFYQWNWFYHISNFVKGDNIPLKFMCFGYPVRYFPNVF